MLGSDNGSSCPHVGLRGTSAAAFLLGLSRVDHRMSLSLAVINLSVYDASCLVVALSNVAVVTLMMIHLLETFILAQIVHGLVLTFSLFLDLPLAFQLGLLLGLLFLLSLEFSLPLPLKFF